MRLHMMSDEHNTSPDAFLRCAAQGVHPAKIAQLGERQTEDLKVPRSNLGLGIAIVQLQHSVGADYPHAGFGVAARHSCGGPGCLPSTPCGARTHELAHKTIALTTELREQVASKLRCHQGSVATPFA